MSTYFIETDGFHMAGEIIMEFIISYTGVSKSLFESNHAF